MVDYSKSYDINLSHVEPEDSTSAMDKLREFSRSYAGGYEMHITSSGVTWSSSDEYKPGEPKPITVTFWPAAKTIMIRVPADLEVRVEKMFII
jgi:hypothetical protein